MLEMQLHLRLGGLSSSNEQRENMWLQLPMAECAIGLHTWLFKLCSKLSETLEDFGYLVQEFLFLYFFLILIIIAKHLQTDRIVLLH